MPSLILYLFSDCFFFRLETKKPTDIAIISVGLNVAEEERFELSDGVNRRWFSRPVHSAALPPLRNKANNKQF